MGTQHNAHLALYLSHLIIVVSLFLMQDVLTVSLGGQPVLQQLLLGGQGETRHQLVTTDCHM